MIRETIEDVVKDLKESARSGLVIAKTYKVWSICLSYDDLIGWLLTVKLIGGSRSVDSDWEDLGKITRACGAPPGVPQSIYDDPSGTHRWSWKDDP